MFQYFFPEWRWNKMNKRLLISLYVVVVIALSPVNVLAQSQIVDIVFCTGVEHRQPIGIFNPPGHCERLDSAQLAIPVIDSKMYRTVYLWTRVKAEEVQVMRHTWYKDGIEFKQTRTEYSWIDKVLKFVGDIKIGLGWKKVASIDLTIKASSSYRTWSKKEIDPIVHKGDWKVVITPASDPSNILCVAKFKIK